MLEFQNAVTNGVLCYIASARRTLSDQAMISICQAFYSHEKIFEAKELLYNFTDDNIVKRRGDGRAKADLTDIITLFEKLEENNVQLPKFLADDFRGSRKIPPTKIPPTKIPPTKIPPSENSTHVKFHPTID